MDMTKTAAVIMAGGRGERLRPITDSMPKPCVPIGDKPALASAAMMLARLGVTHAVLTVMYRYEDVIDTCGDELCGVKLIYYVEKEPLGTAGGVREAVKMLGDYEELIVLSGDAVTDLSRAVAVHRLNRAAATLILIPSDDPSRYGVVDIDEGGRIRRFEEKPKDAVPGALINTGIYVLSKRAVGMMPKEGGFDFGRGLFPLMQRVGERMYGVVGDGYWCDIGMPDAYIECCRRAALGDIKGFTAEAHVSGGIICGRAAVGKGAILPECVIMDGVTLGDDVRAKGVVFCKGVTVGSRVTVGANSIIGEGAFIGDGVRIPSGTKLAPNSSVESGAVAFAENL